MNTANLKSWIRSGLVVLLAVGGMRVAAQVDCLGVDGGLALPGTPCDDEDPSTQDDMWYPGCFCLGICDPIEDSEPCDDGSPLTINDQMTVCGCMGTCIGFYPCDDLNPWTSDDVLWPRWCICEGVCDSPPGTLCDDENPATTGEFLDAYCQCVGGSNMISGQVFLDLDQDGVFGGSDVALPNRTVQAGPGNRYTASDDLGNFYIVVPSGNYVLSAFPGSFDVMAQTPPTINLPGEGLISNGHALAMNPTSLEPDLCTHACMSWAVPGFSNNIYAITHNNGTVAVPGVMSLTHDLQLEFISAQTPSVIVGNSVTWEVPVLHPGERYLRRANLLTPVSLPMGSVVTDVIHSVADPADNVPGNDELVRNRTVMSSWDPNDKQVFPSILTPDEVASGRPVEYMIRFQNTGTFPATTVRITDQLPQQVQPSSLEFIASSHPCHTNYRDGVLEFVFDGIMLPDSNANEPESHGFVMFSVTPRSNLLPGDSVWNRAYIYFDFNEPVITNAATFSVELSTSFTPSAVEAPSPALWPNPTTDQLNILMDRTSRTASVTIIDMSGRIVRSLVNVALLAGTLTLTVSDLADGLYTLRIGDGLKAQHQRFVVSR